MTDAWSKLSLQAGTEDHKRWSAIHRAPPGPDRWKFRSRTFDGIAQAMADQWGGYAMQSASYSQPGANHG